MTPRFMLPALVFALVATVTFAAAEGEEAGATTEQEMVRDPSTGEMIKAPQYGGQLTVAALRAEPPRMRTYVIRRLLLVVPTLFGVTIMVFLIVRSIPGDVIDVLMSEMSELGGSVDRERIMQMLGLDVPVHVQYGRWIGGVLQGDR